MFTQTLTKRVLGSNLVDLLTGPHGVDRYTELVAPTWTLAEARAKVVAVRRSTPRSVTLTLEPNAVFTDCNSLEAGQHVNLTLEIDGRRRTRCYSPANAQGASLLELTIGLHDGGLVSTYLRTHARPGMIVGLHGAGGDFVLPAQRPRRMLFVSGGSGITPIMSMLRTLQAERFDGEVAVIHYARSAAEACYSSELAAMPGVHVLNVFTREGGAPGPSGNAGPTGHFDADHLAVAMPVPDAVFVCGPPALVDAVRECCPQARSESFVPAAFVIPAGPSGGRVTFTESGVGVIDDGRSLLEQAENAGLSPENGCRMGICHTCTRRVTSGAVRNLTNGAVSTPDDEDVQICVSVPVGDVKLAL